jgi:molybdopterin-guanine dinucleotide biosynthesis protein A
MREHGERKMRLLFDRVKTAYYDVPVRKELENINTPKEYEQWIKGYKAGGAYGSV